MSVAPALRDGLLPAHGWSGWFADAFARVATPSLEPARVLTVGRGSYRIVTATREMESVFAQLKAQVQGALQARH